MNNKTRRDKELEKNVFLNSSDKKVTSSDIIVLENKGYSDKEISKILGIRKSIIKQYTKGKNGGDEQIGM